MRLWQMGYKNFEKHAKNPHESDEPPSKASNEIFLQLPKQSPFEG
jgi:hypothetical protein